MNVTYAIQLTITHLARYKHIPPSPSSYIKMVQLSTLFLGLVGLTGLAQAAPASYFCNKHQRGQCTIAEVKDHGRRYFQIYDNNCNKISGQAPGRSCSDPYLGRPATCIDSQLKHTIVLNIPDQQIWYGAHAGHFGQGAWIWDNGNMWAHQQQFPC